MPRAPTGRGGASRCCCWCRCPSSAPSRIAADGRPVAPYRTARVARRSPRSPRSRSRCRRSTGHRAARLVAPAPVLTPTRVAAGRATAGRAGSGAAAGEKGRSGAQLAWLPAPPRLARRATAASPQDRRHRQPPTDHCKREVPPRSGRARRARSATMTNLAALDRNVVAVLQPVADVSGRPANRGAVARFRATISLPGARRAGSDACLQSVHLGHLRELSAIVEKPSIRPPSAADCGRARRRGKRSGALGGTSRDGDDRKTARQD